MNNCTELFVMYLHMHISLSQVSTPVLSYTQHPFENQSYLTQNAPLFLDYGDSQAPSYALWYTFKIKSCLCQMPWYVLWYAFKIISRSLQSFQPNPSQNFILKFFNRVVKGYAIFNHLLISILHWSSMKIINTFSSSIHCLTRNKWCKIRHLDRKKKLWKNKSGRKKRNSSTIRS